MKTIHLEDHEYVELRRLLGRAFDLHGDRPPVTEKNPQPWGYLIPHSDTGIFPGRSRLTPPELAGWIASTLRQPPRNGTYYVPTARRWSRLSPGSVCLFHKNKLIVAYGKVAKGLQDDTSRPGYEGFVTFDPDSLQLLNPMISFDKAKEAIGVAINPRSIQQITLDQAEKVVTLRS